jgi:hypothetical protein
MNTNYKILLLEKGVMQVKHEMKYEYKCPNLHYEIEGWYFQDLYFYYPMKHTKLVLVFGGGARVFSSYLVNNGIGFFL